MTEFYPMPMFVKLQVKNMDESVNWYKEKLGFQSVFEMKGMAHLRGAKYQDLMLLASNEADGLKGSGMIINFNAENIDIIAEKAVREGAEIVEGPVLRPWNTKELVLKDPDGYILTFSAPVDIHKKFEEVIERI